MTPKPSAAMENVCVQWYTVHDELPV